MNVGQNQVITKEFFDDLSKNTNLSNEEASGFSVSYRASTMENQLQFLQKQFIDFKEGEVLIDIGCGSSDLTVQLFRGLLKEKAIIYAFDGEPQLGRLRHSMGEDEINYTVADFRDGNSISKLSGVASYILLNSVIQYLIVDQTVEEICERLLILAANNCKIIIADIPNVDLAKRYYKENWRCDYVNNSSIVNDEVIIEIISKLRGCGFSCYCVDPVSLGTNPVRENIVAERC